MDVNQQDQEPTHPIYKFGWWPEIFGVLAVCLVIWYLITFARGSI